MDRGGGDVLTAARDTSAANAKALAMGLYTKHVVILIARMENKKETHRKRRGSIGVITLVATGDTPGGMDRGVAPDLAEETGDAPGVDTNGWTCSRPSMGLVPWWMPSRARTASISADAVNKTRCHSNCPYESKKKLTSVRRSRRGVGLRVRLFHGDDARDGRGLAPCDS